MNIRPCQIENSNNDGQVPPQEKLSYQLSNAHGQHFNCRIVVNSCINNAQVLQAVYYYHNNQLHCNNTAFCARVLLFLQIQYAWMIT
jgi:hypothetical protein